MRLLIGLLFVLWGCSSQGTNRSISYSGEIIKIALETEIKLYGESPDSSAVMRQIDQIAERVVADMKAHNGAEEPVISMNHVIFEELGITALPESSATEYSCVTHVLSAHKGNCLGIVGLSLAVAERAGLNQFSGVLLPGHVFIRCQNDSGYVNIEPLKNGIQRTDEFYRATFNVPTQAREYMRPLEKKEFIALLLFNLANEYHVRGMNEDALRTYEKTLRLFPDFKEAQDNREQLLALIGKN